MTDMCSSILQNILPPKLKDRGSFTIHCEFGNNKVYKGLADLEASVNLMPLSLYKTLGLGEVRPTSGTFQMADRSYTRPEVNIEDVLVKVGKFISPADLVILDYDADVHVPIILGRGFKTPWEPNLMCAPVLYV